ncbi:MAG: NifU family protein [Pseudodesulfovibrio sp.]|uniref:Nitrogen-fixing NifU domain protein n=1 Tax=Pseudodesulfovibrio aespoeensis (strain ATCC 700646 / DSM 10631 / Aspo-2) TaxID=643562 RepID=E6VXI7_PSEA9|nr:MULTISPECIES: NifU family protein [Pseudodesulfovibrio]MBU4193046.1 NifU family protein [Pseudomonadota bacterium]ADU63803.1 nitrogen-fixing NifU domain protein [Pseudodesulfovibrio aespoeensis Aspo-2]MBU4242933.1 NifU family protein [Pseudomonadota bacterium]MBU4378250.1 NifU family protein [Pseudomonadota bacterium]MBU4475611.1 NifU family protein [Pseudomonadota bacterium]
MREKVMKVLDKVRPALQGDGGDVELVDITDKGIVQVRLTGACKGCPMSQMTLKNGIERIILKEIPEIKGVEAVS